QRAARAHRPLAPLHTPTPCAPAFLPPEPAFTSACALARHSDRADPAANAASNAGALPTNRSCTSRPAGTPDLRFGRTRSPAEARIRTAAGERIVAEATARLSPSENECDRQQRRWLDS